VRKSLGGTGGTRGTASPRDENPGAASARARRSRRNGRTSREKNSRTARRRNGRWVRPTSTRRRSTAGLINTAKGRSEPHGRRRAPKGARPGCDNSPNRGPGTCAERKAATNDPRGRRLHHSFNESPGDARRQKPQGRVREDRIADVGVDSAGRANQRRSGMVRRPDASKTERRGQRTPKGRESRNLTRGGRPACPPRARRAATDRPGRRWWSRKPTPRVPRAADRLAHFSEQVFTGRERLEKREPKRARTLRRAPQRKTDADGTHR